MSRPFRPTPQHKPHSECETRVNHWLACRGFYTKSLAYHEVLPKGDPVRKRLEAIYSPTALILRHRPDRIAVHREMPCSFLFEIKTKGYVPGRKVTIDLVTIAANAQVGAGGRVLYILANHHTDMERGFWQHEMPAISKLDIPDWKWGGTPIRRWYDFLSRKLFEGQPPDYDRDPGDPGSGDPFVTIEAEVVLALPHWHGLVEQELRRCDEEFAGHVRRQRTRGPSGKALDAMRYERLGQLRMEGIR